MTAPLSKPIIGEPLMFDLSSPHYEAEVALLDLWQIDDEDQATHRLICETGDSMYARPVVRAWKRRRNAGKKEAA